MALLRKRLKTAMHNSVEISTFLSLFSKNMRSRADIDNWMNVAGPLVMITKMLVLSFIIMWVRFSYPRLREDQLQRFAWKVLIPVSLINIMLTAIFKVAF